MKERALGSTLGVLLAILGAVAVGTGLTVGARELLAAYHGSPLLPALAVALFCGVVVAGGATLIRGAVRGRIAFRRPRPGAAS